MPPSVAPTKLSDSFEIWTDDVFLEMTKKISEAFTLTLDDVDKLISSQLVLVVNMCRKRNTRCRTSMRHKRKVFSYF